MTVGGSVVEQPVSIAHSELKILGIPPSPHGLPPCVLDAFHCLDNTWSRIIESSILLLFSITLLLGQQTSWEARLHCSVCMLLPPTFSPTPPAYPIPTAFCRYPFFFCPHRSMSVKSFQLTPTPLFFILSPLRCCHCLHKSKYC